MRWPDVMEVMVKQNSACKIFLKYSHLESEYDSISLKRLNSSLSDFKLFQLNEEPRKIIRKKYGDLVSLCQGETPMVRLP